MLHGPLPRPVGVRGRGDAGSHLDFSRSYASLLCCSRGLWRLLLSSAHGGATTLLEGGGKRHTAQMNCRSCPVWRGRDLHRAGQSGGP